MRMNFTSLFSLLLQQHLRARLCPNLTNIFSVAILNYYHYAAAACKGVQLRSGFSRDRFKVLCRWISHPAELNAHIWGWSNKRPALGLFWRPFLISKMLKNCDVGNHQRSHLQTWIMKVQEEQQYSHCNLGCKTGEKEASYHTLLLDGTAAFLRLRDQTNWLWPKIYHLVMIWVQL